MLTTPFLRSRTRLILLRRCSETVAITIIAFTTCQATPDVKIVSRTGRAFAGKTGTDETLTYIKGDRKRVEERRQMLQPLGPQQSGYFVFVDVPPIVRITRCDLDREFILNFGTREYMSHPVPKLPSREEIAAFNAQRRNEAAAKPTLLVETDTEDTSERKQMLGYTARHIITTQKQIPLVESGGLAQENVTDGWYIDLDTSTSCTRGSYSGTAFLLASSARPGEPPQVPVLAYKNVGKAETGFALTTSRISRLIDVLPDRSTKPKDNPRNAGNQMHVIEISLQPLDASLFEVPGNFREVSQFRPTPIVPYWRQALGWMEYYWMRMQRAVGSRTR